MIPTNNLVGVDIIFRISARLCPNGSDGRVNIQFALVLYILLVDRLVPNYDSGGVDVMCRISGWEDVDGSDGRVGRRSPHVHGGCAGR